MKKIICSILITQLLSQIVEQYKQASKTRGNPRPLRQLPYETQVIAENLEIPWAIAISDEGTIYFTERPGTIRMIENGMLQPEPLITFEEPFADPGEGGLMGIVLDPNFLQNRYMYVMHTYLEDEQILNRVVRLIQQDREAVIDEVIIDEIPGGEIHNGGRIKIGPDQKLYITTGDAGIPALSQDPESLAGKILRIELDGSIPEDNPIPGSPVYSLGHRNPQGLAWSPQNILYASEHGPIGYDEINIIEPGSNYGWPLVQGDEDTDEADVQQPLAHSGEDTWAPSGIAFIDEGPWQGRLVMAGLRSRQLLSFILNEAGTEVIAIEPQLQNEYGRLREAFLADDGSIYLATSNRDGRGDPTANDDRIIRLIPRG